MAGPDKPIRVSSRDAILQAAAQVWSSRPSASLADVAERAGVGRATLHRHFAGRDALLVELTRESLVLMEDARAGILENASTVADAFRDIIAALVPVGERFHFLTGEMAVMDDEEVRRLYSSLLRDFSTLIERGKAEGLIAEDLDQRWAVTAFDMLLFAGWVSVGEGSMTREEASRHMLRTVLHGFGPVPEGAK